MHEKAENWLFRLVHPSLLYLDSKLNVQFVISSLLYLSLCFVLLGICASDYLCPAVSNISNGRKGSAQKGLLAAILLSWCNSSPDLFTNFMSWTSSNAAALSVGEVLGSCGFIMCVVQGAVFIVMSKARVGLEPEQRQHVTRDLGFILVAMLMMLYVCLQNEVTLLNCVFMMGVYAAYIASKAGVRYSKPTSDDANHTDWNSPEEAFPEMTAGAFSSGADSGHKFNILSAMDYSALYEMMERSTSSPDDAITLQTLRSDIPGTTFVSPRPITEPSASRLPFLDNVASPVQSSPSTFQPFHDSDDISEAGQALLAEPIKYSKIAIKRLQRLRKGAFFLLAPQLLGFGCKSLSAKALALATTPFTVLLRFSCPQYYEILQFDRTPSNLIELERAQLMLLLVQALLAPSSSLVLLWVLAGILLRWYYLLAAGITAIALLVSVAFLQLAAKKYNRFSLNEDHSSDDRKLKRLLNAEKAIIILFNSFGILNSILWISTLANALVEVMEVYQRFTSVSEAVLGLTIFSWGNSISDLMSNVAMCQLYRKNEVEDTEETSRHASRSFFISLSACFGGILLNSLIGIGLSGFVAMLINTEGTNEKNSWILRSVSLDSSGVDFKFMVSVSFIIIQNLFLLSSFCGVRTFDSLLEDKRKLVGILMCSWWGAATLVNVLIESFVD
ncbi:Ecm27p [Lachancea thermotolerans CBS 6340]|uniref:KLTH0E01364p n=1 Tax=Lachancea thermotolerans (strain ATCC 56472 / CBS 6340 / NRRL Y-8284) TaxID=559295 RepID=C5DH50_LACTC|nr:KLTH0E01364p [Lachancea thermotolerans CBS 6340]CAR23111.1 KLTH0E01364p [Lachancea thermotolerans CBS 6340]